MAKMVILSLCLTLLALAPSSRAECSGSVRGGSCGGGYEEVRTVPASSYVKTVRYETVPAVSYREYSTPVVRESSPCRSGGCSSYTYERTVPSASTVVRDVSPCRSGGCSSYTYERTVPSTVVREDSPCRSGGCSSYTYETRTVPVSQPVVYERVYSAPVSYSVPSSYSSGCSTGRCGGGYSSRTVEYSSYPSSYSYSYSPVVRYSSGGGCRSGGCSKKK